MLRLLLELFAVFFAITTIYRRILKPFIQGITGQKKSGSSTDTTQGPKFYSSAQKKNMKPVDPKEIQDAEFEEIK